MMEFIAHRVCGQEDIEMVVVPDEDYRRLDAMLANARDRGVMPTRSDLIARLNDLLSPPVPNRGAVMDCPFDGPIDVTVAGGIEKWVCPFCGYQHEKETDSEV